MEKQTKHLLFETISKIRQDFICSYDDSDYYYGRLMSQIYFEICTDTDIICVMLRDNFYIGINPKPFLELSVEQQKGVIKHELLHICFGHLTNPVYHEEHINQKRMNVAMDLVINQFIPFLELPDCGCFIQDYKGFPTFASSMEYYKLLPENTDFKLQHDWRNINGKKLGSLLNSILNEIESDLRAVGKSSKNISKHININKNYTSLTKLERLIRQSVVNTSKINAKIGRGYNKAIEEYDTALKIRVKPKILFIIDESGSVSEEELKEFVAIVVNIQRQYDVEIRAFDTTVGEPKQISLNNNTYERTMLGGTDLNCVLKFYKEQKTYNTMFVLTDGHFPKTNVTCNKQYTIIICSKGTTDNVRNHKNILKINKDIIL